MRGPPRTSGYRFELAFDTYRAHEDWCRWRAPFWHGTRVMDEHSHANYHLGFDAAKVWTERVLTCGG